MKEQYSPITYYEDDCENKPQKPQEELSSNTVNELVLFPNPAMNIAYASYEGSTDQLTQIRISDVAERTLIHQGMNSPIISLNTANLPSGVYMCDLLQDSKLLSRSKLIIVK